MIALIIVIVVVVILVGFLILSYNGLVRSRNQVVNQRGETVLTYNPLRMLRRR